MKFSQRTRWNTEESDLARHHRERLAAGLPVADLTASNPTRCGLDYAPNLLTALSDPAALDYDPNPLGSLDARQAVCQYYADHGAEIDPERIVLTTSSSEAYSNLFKLLCDPGDEILVPQPSYPLFDFLADAEVVRITSAPLIYDYGWQLDLAGLRKQISGRTKAIILVHPNNPTGHFTRLTEATELAAICREHNLALIIDEVFLDYAHAPATQDSSSFATRNLDILTFIVSGLSKIAGLPQMKAAWLIAFGPGSEEAMERLEVLADTYLSMNAPIQRALPTWLQDRSAIQSQIRQRVLANLAELDRQLAVSPAIQLIHRLAIEGGWYTILRIPALQPDEQTAAALLDRGVWIHPGYFFGMAPRSGWLVVSLLGQPEEFATGIAIVCEYVDQLAR